MAINTDVRLTFPNEKLREDFEAAFRGWLKQYQQAVTLQYALMQGAGQQQSQPTQAGLGPQEGSQQGLGPTPGHSFGFQGGQQAQQGQQAQALFSWGGGSVSDTPYGSGSSGGVYLNFIGGW